MVRCEIGGSQLIGWWVRNPDEYIYQRSMDGKREKEKKENVVNSVAVDSLEGIFITITINVKEKGLM